MNQEKENSNDVSDELKPVKDKPEKKLSRGCSIAITATVAVVLVGLFQTVGPTQGAPRSARLTFEQRKMQIEQQIAQDELDAESETPESNPAK